MSNTTETIESYQLQLCEKAKHLGASQVVTIPASDVVLDERTLLKCMVPICSHYGVDLMCPPNVLTVSKFKEILGQYNNAVLIKVDIPPDGLTVEPGDLDKPQTPTTEYLSIVREAKLKLHEIVCQVESMCVRSGYYFAAGLVGGSCSLCDECVGIESGLSCRHPFKARPAMEAMGIDVVATVRKAGLDLGFGRDESKGWIGLVLVS